MAYSDKTEHYGLPSYSGSDRPKMLDFNEAYRQIDGALAEKQDDLEAAGVLNLGGEAVAQNSLMGSAALNFHCRHLGDRERYPYDARIQVLRAGAGGQGRGDMTLDAAKVSLPPVNGDLEPSMTNVFGLGTPTASWGDVYSANGVVTTSDAREKKEIRTLDGDKSSAFLRALNPVQYKFREGTRTHYGLIAQEVEKAMGDLGLSDADFAGLIKSPADSGAGEPEVRYGLRYTEFIALLLRVVQRQQEEIDALKQAVYGR